ncbi:hypothetical protein STCU_08218 [Strigomonas culicis]|uniref:Uncharacterized protein n=1 Tax=Strigomonas culicis TaxID=28005 RepID=S9U101_9TRYP|nr:hypothetical protein STCU_08218 [Strigomonas culicis]|eukprot:EPY22573.1 hypothetical protein STCU_08218 [Strigomonas culicis]
MVQGFASLQALFTAPPGATDVAVRPLGRAVSLAEVGLRAFVQNTHTVFRKSQPAGEKRSRDATAAGRDEAADIPAPPTATRALSLQQRRERFGLYSARQPALLPRVDAALAPYGVAASPARRLFTLLNGRAEAAFLQQRWRLGTKCALLREAPQIKELVDRYRQALEEVERVMAAAGTDAGPVTPAFYFQFGSEEHYSSASASSSSDLPHPSNTNTNNNGVVRINVQSGLFVDVTFDAVRRSWVVLALHWNVWQPAAAVVGYGSTHYSGAALRPAAAPADGVVDAEACGAVPPFFRVLPARHAAMMEFLGRRFREGGLAQGCAAATQLLCAVCLDLLAVQLAQLGLHTLHSSASDTALAGTASAVFSTDLRKGCYMVCRVVRPLVYEAGAERPADAPGTAAKASLHLRLEVAGGTVLLERVWSSHALEKRYTGLLSAPMWLRQGEGGDTMVAAARPAGPADGRVVVLDAEALIWRYLLSQE